MHIVSKKWGYEIWIENNEMYCGKHLHVLPTKWCSVHFHKNKKETFYVINGSMKLQYSESHDKEYWEKNLANEIILTKGQFFTLETMIAHRFTSASNDSCDFIEISTHHDDNDSYRIIESI